MATVNDKMTAIADAIRNKTGGTEKLGLDDMSQAIPEVYDAGKEAGIEEGKQAQYDEFWDIYQQNGNRTNYSLAFSSERSSVTEWNKDTFRPKYDIKPTNFYWAMRGNNVGDLATHLEMLGVQLDTSNCTNMMLAFQNSYSLTHLPTLDVRKCIGTSALSGTFAYCWKLHTIDKLIVCEDNIYTDTFVETNSLKHITIEGVIGNTISFRLSPLTKESITSVIEHLSTTATGKTLTLKKTAVDNAFAWKFAKEVYFGGEIAEYVNTIALHNSWGDGVEIGEYILVCDETASGTGTMVNYRKTVLKKVGTNINESTGVDHGVWTVSAAVVNTPDANGIFDEADIGEYNDEWTSLVETKANWTISLV